MEAAAVRYFGKVAVKQEKKVNRPADEEDSVVIEKILSGNREAFGIIVNKYRMQSVRIAAAMTGDMETARDLTQDAFIKAYQALGRFNRNARFLPWFYQILRNVCRDYLRRRKRYKFVREQLKQQTELQADALEHLRRREIAIRVREAVSKLSPANREIIELKHFSGLKYEEIAEVLDIPKGTVMSRLFYARKELRKLLDDSLEPPADGGNHDV